MSAPGKSCCDQNVNVLGSVPSKLTLSQIAGILKAVHNLRLEDFYTHALHSLWCEELERLRDSKTGYRTVGKLDVAHGVGFRRRLEANVLLWIEFSM